MKNTIVYLIRHAETVNEKGIRNTTEDSQMINEKEILSVEGEEQAKKLSQNKELQNLDVIWSSSYTRAKSTAKYISLSDHDDIWYPTKIEECIKALKEKNVDLVYCDAKQVDENGEVLHESYLRYKNIPIINQNYNKKILPFSRHIAIGCCQLFTKEVKNLMLPFTDKTIAHDWHSLYIANNLKGVYCLDKPLMDYRLHGNNAFGGRSFKQNMQIWKKENGNGYKSYMKYRHKVITDAYLAGVLMRKDFSRQAK